MFTPVDEQGSPAFGEIEKLTDALINDGVDGLYLLGSTGQGVMFDEEQRREILEVMAVARETGALVMVHAENEDAIRFLVDRTERSGETAPA